MTPQRILLRVVIAFLTATILLGSLGTAIDNQTLLKLSVLSAIGTILALGFLQLGFPRG
jgi:hypothetical protein